MEIGGEGGTDFGKGFSEFFWNKKDNHNIERIQNKALNVME